MMGNHFGPTTKDALLAHMRTLLARGPVIEELVYDQCYSASFYAGRYDVRNGWPVVREWLMDIATPLSDGQRVWWIANAEEQSA